MRYALRHCKEKGDGMGGGSFPTFSEQIPALALRPAFLRCWPQWQSHRSRPLRKSQCLKLCQEGLSAFPFFILSVFWKSIQPKRSTPQPQNEKTQPFCSRLGWSVRVAFSLGFPQAALGRVP